MTNEQFIDLLIEQVKNAPDEERAMFCEDIIVQCMLFGAYNTFEALGIVELAKQDYLERLEEYYGGDDDDYEDGDEWKRLIKK